MCAAHTQGRGRSACIAMQVMEEQCTSGAPVLVMGMHSSQIVKQSRQPIRQSSESLYNTRMCAARTCGYKISLHIHAGERYTSPIMGNGFSHNTISKGSRQDSSRVCHCVVHKQLNEWNSLHPIINTLMNKSMYNLINRTVLFFRLTIGLQIGCTTKQSSCSKHGPQCTPE